MLFSENVRCGMILGLNTLKIKGEYLAMFGKMKVRYQIFIVILMMVGAMSLLTFVLMDQQQKQMLEVYEKDSVMLLEAQEKNLSIQIEEIEKGVFNMCLNNEFVTTLSDYMNSKRGTPSILERSRIENVVSNFLLNRSDIKNVWIHTSRGDFYRMIYGPRTNLKFEETQVAKFIEGHPAGSILWGVGQKNEFYSNQADRVIPMVMRYNLRFSAAVEPEVVDMVVLISENSIYRSLNSGTEPEEVMLLMNEDRQLVFAGDEELEAQLQEALDETLEKGSTEVITYGGTRYLFSVTEVSTAPWYLIRLTEENAVFGGMQQLFRVSRFLLVMITAAAFVISWNLSRRITIPLEKLAVTCQKVGDGEMSLRFEEETGQPEIRLLGEHFNTMLNHVDRLIHELEEQKEWARIEQLLKRRAELKALQSQINPHFLYNTLESISWKAIDAGCDEISDMTQSLAAMFRTGLSQGKEMVPLSVEMKNVVSYLEIQKIRYEDLFDYEMVYEQAQGDLFTVKLVLQPLVENSIYHGLKEHEEQRGIIRIMVCDKGDYLEIDVQDNGRGFTKEKLDTVNDQLKKRILMENGSYGIYNVNERLKLYFGEEYGLRYEMDEEYTHAILTFPKVVREEIEKYVQYYGN